jgi:hypothetical protein
MAGVNMRLKAGTVRELHWHKEAEWSHMLKGKARITPRTFSASFLLPDRWFLLTRPVDISAPSVLAIVAELLLKLGIHRHRKTSATLARQPLDVAETAAPNKINFNGVSGLQTHVRRMRFSDLQSR